MSFVARPDPGKKVSPFELRKALAGFGSVQHCTLRKDGQFLITLEKITVSPAPSEISVAGIKVRLSPAPASTVRGTIFSSELAGCSAAELKEELLEPVADVKCLPTRYAKEDSGRFLLTFVGRDLPESVKLNCGLILPVKTHVPTPLRCRKCFTYGHHEDSCSAGARCAQCSLPAHEGACSAPPNCIACGKEHAVTSTDCPRWKREMEINRIRFTEGLSTTAAAQKYKSSSSRGPVPTARIFSPSSLIQGRSFAETVNAHAPTPATNSPAPTPTIMDKLELIIMQQNQRLTKLEELIIIQTTKADRLIEAVEQQTELLKKIYAQNQLILATCTPTRTGSATRSSKRLNPESSGTASPRTNSIANLLEKSAVARENALAPAPSQLPPPPIGDIFNEPPN